MFPQRATRSVIRSIAAARLVRGVTPVAFVVFAASLIMLHRMGAGPVENLRSVISDAAAPVLSSLSAPFVSAAESVDTIADLRQMRADNIQLKKDNEKLRQWYETALRVQAENLALKELLNVKADPALNFVTARVISDPGGTFVQSYLLAVGAEDHIRKGSAVMSGQSLIGRIVAVGQKSSRMLLLTDMNSRIPVVVQNTRTRGILAGTNTDVMRLERLPPDSGLTVGQRVVTSGDGGQLPVGVPVGIITRVSKTGVDVKPLGDIQRMNYVQVIDTGIDNLLLSADVAGP